MNNGQPPIGEGRTNETYAHEPVSEDAWINERRNDEPTNRSRTRCHMRTRRGVILLLCGYAARAENLSLFKIDTFKFLARTMNSFSFSLHPCTSSPIRQLTLLDNTQATYRAFFPPLTRLMSASSSFDRSHSIIFPRNGRGLTLPPTTTLLRFGLCHNFFPLLFVQFLLQFQLLPHRLRLQLHVVQDHAHVVAK